MSKFKPNYIGYCRVSSKDQHLARQIKAVTNYGVDPKNIYKEKVSGATIAKRPQIKNLLKDINRTNVIVVLALDRLGRNYHDIKYIIDTIKAKGAKLVVLNLPMSRKYGADKLLGNILNEFVINILAYQADHERKAIKARQRQGIEIAKANGKYHGRKPEFTLDNPTVKEAVNQYHNRKNNGLSATQIARMNGMSRKTLYRKVAEYKNHKA